MRFGFVYFRGPNRVNLLHAPMILAHGFYVINEFIGLMLGIIGVSLLAFFLLRGPAQQSLVLSVLATIIGLPLLYAAYLVAFHTEPQYEKFSKLWMGGVACSPFILGCIGLCLWFRRRKH